MLHAARWKYRRKNDSKNRHLHTIAQLCRAISWQGIYRQSKKLLNSNMSSTCVHNMANFGPLMADDLLASLGHPSKFQRVSRLAFITAVMSRSGGQPNFARCLAICWAGRLYVHFRRLLPTVGILPDAKFTLRPSLAFFYWQRYCTASTTLCGVVQGMELRNFCAFSFSLPGAKAR